MSQGHNVHAPCVATPASVMSQGHNVHAPCVAAPASITQLAQQNHPTFTQAQLILSTLTMRTGRIPLGYITSTINLCLLIRTGWGCVLTRSNWLGVCPHNQTGWGCVLTNWLGGVLAWSNWLGVCPHMIKLAGGVSSHDQMGLENENFIRTQVKLSSEISTLYKSVITCSLLDRVVVGRISALVNWKEAKS